MKNFIKIKDQYDYGFSIEPENVITVDARFNLFSRTIYWELAYILFMNSKKQFVKNANTKFFILMR
jgi:hypothetical protein